MRNKVKDFINNLESLQKIGPGKALARMLRLNGRTILPRARAVPDRVLHDRV